MQIGEGERVAGEGALGVTLLADLEQVGIASVRREPSDGVVPQLHLHERHAECFLVLSGELTFRLEDRELRAGPGTCTLIPPGVLHSSTVTGDSPAHYLDLHAPSCGFGNFVRALYLAGSEEDRQQARAAFDQQPIPEYASGDPGTVVIRRSGRTEGETITDLPGRRAAILLDSDELVISECHYGGGERGAPLHMHREHADGFLVLDGELTFKLRDGRMTGQGGTLALFPPGLVHGFDNDSESEVHYFNLHLPASGFADYLRGRNPAFDQHDPPADGGLDPSELVAVRIPG